MLTITPPTSSHDTAAWWYLFRGQPGDSDYACLGHAHIGVLGAAVYNADRPMEYGLGLAAVAADY